MNVNVAHDPDGSGPTLVGMFVDPAERRHRVGVALVEAVTAWARTRGAARLYLWGHLHQHSGHGALRPMLFRATGEARPIGHTPSLAELRMVRDLTRG